MRSLVLIPFIDDVIVTNTHTISNATNVGGFGGGYGHGGFGGLTAGVTQGSSVNFGDLVFMKEGRTLMTLSKINDPQGVVNIVKSVQKQMYPDTIMGKIMDEIKKRVDQQFSERGYAFCGKCGRKNKEGSNFCNTCGGILG